MAVPEETNLCMVKGDDFSMTITIKENDIAKDITGWSVYFTIKTLSTDPDVDAIYTQDITTHTLPTQGITTVSIPNTASDDFSTGSVYYDVQTKDADGEIMTILRGRFTIIQDITIRTT